MEYELNKDKSGYILARGDNEPNVVIPSKYKGKPVTSIDSWAFYGCDRLTTIRIPDSITSIGDFAFEYCRSLTSVKIPDSVTSIGKLAFAYCDSLTSITVGDSITSIGYMAFAYCSSLQYNEYNNAYYLGSSNNQYLVLVKAKDTSIKTCIINDNTRIICKYAFYYCYRLTNIIIPDTVTSIGDSAFYNCGSLTKQLPPQEIKIIKCVKGFNYSEGELKCKDFIYEVGKTYKEDKAELCYCGFHACTCGLDLFNYYAGKDARYYEVELSGITDERVGDSKICGTTITLLRELTIAEAANYRSEIVE